MSSLPQVRERFRERQPKLLADQNLGGILELRIGGSDFLPTISTAQALLSDMPQRVACLLYTSPRWPRFHLREPRSGTPSG